MLARIAAARSHSATETLLSDITIFELNYSIAASSASSGRLAVI
ncbi:MAG TPA: hypothetical protein VF540_04375 [Segetibacter sp.]